MSRAERRQYERMTKGQDRGGLPPVPPGTRARLERRRARRAPEPVQGIGLTLRFWGRALAIALALGLTAFSLAWPRGMPLALYVGLVIAAVACAIQLGIRAVRQRAASR
ncbi:MAG: hypothetical protein M3R49_09745 [Chloroflexota bacterium]|nr:hypothetical protein [Chloroflexota bacterium]